VPVWDPKVNTLNLRALSVNIMDYWEANQADVFTWLGAPTLPPIKDFSGTVANRDTPVWPALAFVGDADGVGYTEDVLNALYQMRFELMVVGTDPDECVVQARLYTHALISMLLNCPPAVLLLNSGVMSTEVVVEETTVDFLEILKEVDDGPEWMQRAQLAATVRVQGSYFA
jgi:hypothetical protein